MSDIGDYINAAPPVPAQPEAAPDQSGQWVNAVDPTGELVSIPANRLTDSLNNGWKMPTPQDLHQATVEAKYGSGEQQAATAAEGAAKGLLGPAATFIETAYGHPGISEDIAGREEANPGIHGAAEAGTFLGSAVAGTGEAALLGEAGKGLEAAAGLDSSTRIAKAGTDAAKAAFEGGLYQGGEELHKAFLNDPNQTAESAITNIGISSILGGVFGGSVGAVLGAKQIASEAAPFISELDHPKLAAGDLHTAMNVAEDVSPSLKDKVLDAIRINKEKPDAGAYRTAATDLGLPIPSGSTLDNHYVDRARYALSKNPYTVAGDAIGTQLNDAWTKASNVLQDAVKSDGASSTEEFGNNLKSHMTQSIQDAYAPQQEAFKALQAIHSSVPLEGDVVAALSKALGDIKEVRLSANSEEGRLVRQVLRSAERAQTADDITTLHNMASLQDTSSASSKDPLSYIKGVIKDKLTDIQEGAIERYSKSFARNDEAGAYMKSMVDGFRDQKQLYKPYIQKVSQLSEWLGKGSIKGTGDALHFIENRLSSTELAGKVMTASKDPEFIRFLKKDFPDVHQMVVDHQKATQLAKASPSGDFSPKKFIDNYSKLEPEIQKALYTPEQQGTISKLQLYYKNAFPKEYNPSGTAAHMGFLGAHESPKSFIIANARDAAIKKVIEKAEQSAQAKQAYTLAQHTVKGESMISSAIQGIFNSSKNIPGSIVPNLANRAKLDKFVETYSADPTKLVAMNDNNTSVPEYSQAFAAAGGRVVNYLASVKPKTDPKLPFDSRRPANSVEKLNYSKALDIAEQPLLVLKAMKEGRMTSKDIAALTQMYPSLYKNVAQKLTEQMVEMHKKGTSLPYATQMGVSMFLGTPLSSSFTPQSIQSAQMSAMKSTQRAQQGPTVPSAASTAGLQKLPAMSQTAEQQRQMSRATGKH